jgi:hypothetical protein
MFLKTMLKKCFSSKRHFFVYLAALSLATFPLVYVLSLWEYNIAHLKLESSVVIKHRYTFSCQQITQRCDFFRR